MFDTMTMTKVLGGACGSLLVFMLGGWAAESIYGSGHGGHGDEHAYGYAITVEDSGAAEVEEGPSFDVLLASADPAAGERVFRKCAACHSLDEGVNGTGPSLYGVVGRAAGAMEGYAYSGALVQVVDNWTPDHLNLFIEKPKSYTPGTAMNFSGIGKATDRANLVAYLQSIGG